MPPSLVKAVVIDQQQGQAKMRERILAVFINRRSQALL
jgi:hypothetical protein